MYVIDKDISNNTIIVSSKTPKTNNLSVVNKVVISKVNFTSSPWINGGKVLVRIRYRQEPQKAILNKISETDWEIVFTKPQGIMAVGQSAVLYKKNECLGGGIIEETF